MRKCGAKGHVGSKLALDTNQELIGGFRLQILVVETMIREAGCGGITIADNQAAEGSFVGKIDFVAGDHTIAVKIGIVGVKPGVTANGVDKRGHARSDGVIETRIVTADNGFAVACKIVSCADSGRDFVERRNETAAIIMQGREQIGNNAVGRNIHGLVAAFGVVKAKSEVEGQAVHAPRVATVNTQRVERVLGRNFIAEFRFARACAYVTARAVEIVQDRVAAILAGSGNVGVLKGKTELEFVIAAKPILLEVVGIEREVMLRSLGVVELEAMFEEEIAVQTDNRLTENRRIEVELSVDECVLHIHIPACIGNPGMFGLEHVGRAMLVE